MYLQLKNPVILVNKGSVIQSAAGQQVAEEVPVQLVHGGVIGGSLAEDEGTRKRREVLARRPSYRKILNDLSMPQQDGQTMGTLQVSRSEVPVCVFFLLAICYQLVVFVFLSPLSLTLIVLVLLFFVSLSSSVRMRPFCLTNCSHFSLFPHLY